MVVFTTGSREVPGEENLLQKIDGGGSGGGGDDDDHDHDHSTVSHKIK
jgi:hypothetical protein